MLPNKYYKSDERGFALMVVIVVMLLVSFLASQLILSLRTEQRIAYNLKQRDRSLFLAEAGVNIALFRLLDTPAAEAENEEFGTILAGYNYTTFQENNRINYSAASESGKMDLNNVPIGLLELFLSHQGLGEDQIATINDSLLDWRDTDNLHRLNGAEQEFYMEQSDPYIPRNGKIKEVAEFFLINGTSGLADKFEVEDAFTVHNPQKTINFNSLTPVMLDFLMAGDTDRKEAYREAQDVYTTLNKAMARQLIGDERFTMIAQYLSYNKGTNRYYTILATGQAGAGPEEENPQNRPGLTVKAMIRLLNKNYQILSWKENLS
jgi:general secretion pathway protein K